MIRGISSICVVLFWLYELEYTSYTFWYSQKNWKCLIDFLHDLLTNPEKEFPSKQIQLVVHTSRWKEGVILNCLRITIHRVYLHPYGHPSFWFSLLMFLVTFTFLDHRQYTLNSSFLEKPQNHYFLNRVKDPKSKLKDGSFLIPYPFHHFDYFSCFLYSKDPDISLIPRKYRSLMLENCKRYGISPPTSLLHYLNDAIYDDFYNYLQECNDSIYLTSLKDRKELYYMNVHPIHSSLKNYKHSDLCYCTNGTSFW